MQVPGEIEFQEDRKKGPEAGACFMYFRDIQVNVTGMK